ncbi:MAG: hypothetical protein ACYS0E_10700 [Planctomycetota bacterium]|jgi:hypothetical protein
MRVLIAVCVAALVLADTGRLQRDVRTARFATAVVCQTCHSNADDSGAMRDVQGRGIAPYGFWQSSMMANSARDPFFRAALVAEVAAAGKQGAAVEARCLHCHAPMASYEARLSGEAGLAFEQLDQEFEEDEEDVAALARDGVSCTLCHQIQAGAKPDGQFEVGDDREIFGPFDKQFGLAMHRVTKYWPVQGRHLLESAHCETCHSSTLPGEVTYLEWSNSSKQKSCQDCHMPTGARTRIARTTHGGDIFNLIPRSPVGRHLFVGGNTLVPKILRDNADALHVKAPAAAFDATIAAARSLLQNSSARVSIEEITRAVDGLRVVVKVENLTGHKFPTGHPSRRAWLRLRVLDPKGKIVFEVGKPDGQGRLPGDTAKGALVPHRDELAGAQLQIYEAVPKGPRIRSHGSEGLIKDNRLLPLGWDAKHAAAPATRAVGVDAEDEDFVAGSDTMAYVVPYAEIQLPYTVEVELLYQPISPRYLAELFEVKHPEIERFKKFYEAAGNVPEVISRDKLVVAY